MTEPIDIQLKQGVLELCVLELLSKEDNYAYEIASRLAEAIGMGEGTTRAEFLAALRAGLRDAPAQGANLRVRNYASAVLLTRPQNLVTSLTDSGRVVDAAAK